MGYLGGVSRRATYVRGVRESGSETILVDLGDALPEAERLAAPKAQVYAGAFRRMGYSALALGDIDLRYMRNGLPTPYGAEAPTICANVTDSTSGALVASKPWVVVRTPSGLRVGIVAVLGENALGGTDRERLRVNVEPPASALARVVPQVRAQADLVILVCHGGWENAKALAATPGIDVALVAHPPMNHSEGVTMVDGRPLMQTWLAGRYLGRMTLDLDRDGRVLRAAGQRVALKDDVRDDPEMDDLLAACDRRIAEDDARAAVESVTGRRAPRPFVSSAKCGECHLREYAQWSNTPHARAFESLRRGDHSGDAECATCHTTGARHEGGFRSESLTPELRGVGCESCHGPGARHVRRPGKGNGAVLRSTCAQCHDTHRESKFDYDAAARRIMHGATQQAVR